MIHTDSISGAMARTPRPEAMMARGARVTGSGAAAPEQAIAVAFLNPMTFASLENFDVEVFL